MANRLRRLARLATLPETRHLIVATARSAGLRTLATRLRHDRSGLRADMNRANARRLVGQAVHHPVAAELASAGLVLLPVRYTPLGWVAAWAARRALRRNRPPGAITRESPPPP